MACAYLASHSTIDLERLNYYEFKFQDKDIEDQLIFIIINLAAELISLIQLFIRSGA